MKFPVLDEKTFEILTVVDLDFVPDLASNRLRIPVVGREDYRDVELRIRRSDDGILLFLATRETAAKLPHALAVSQEQALADALDQDPKLSWVFQSTRAKVGCWSRGISAPMSNRQEQFIALTEEVRELRELLVDCLIEACEDLDGLIDHQHKSAYEAAQHYLVQRGMLSPDRCQFDR